MRLIDADALMRQIERVVAEFLHVGNHSGLFLKYNSCNPAEFTRGYERGAMEIASVVSGCVTVDAVEVVRCGECEYKRELEGHLVCGDSMRAGMGVDVFEIPTYYFNKIAPDDFCSRGRRKDNG